MRWKFGLVEGADAVDFAQNFSRSLVAEIAHHRNARTIAAQRVVQVFKLAHMRHLIQRESHIARP